MKNFSKNLILLFFLVIGFLGPICAFAAGPATVNLNTAGNFVILSKTQITTTGATVITGDIGVSPADSTFIQGFGLTLDGSGTFSTSALVNGNVYAPDYIGPPATTPPMLTTAISHMEAAYTDASGRALPNGTDLYAGIIGGQTFIPGLYKWTTNVTIPTNITLSGGPTDVWIFQIAGNLNISANKKIILTGGALASNVFWAVAGTTTLEPGSIFEGTILSGPGTSAIAGQSGATLHGRALGQKEVTLIANVISAAAPNTATLEVIKHVVKDNGGVASAGDWTLTVSSSNGGSGTGSAVGSEVGTIYTLQTDKAYSVTEDAGPSGYSPSSSSECTIASAVAGNTYTCTITNDDIAPQLIVNKIVINDNGGTKVISNFSLFIDGSSVTSGVANTTTIGAHTVSETADSSYTSTISGNCATNGTITLALGDVKTCTITNDDIAQPSSGSSGGVSRYYVPVPPLIDVVKVPSPLALPGGPGTVKYTYTLRNIGTVPVTNITMVGDTCSPITLISGDTNADARLDVSETWVHTCSTTLTKTHTNIVTTIGWANGISATDIANATVVVGVPVVPPLIHVTKVPSPLVLSALGGMVKYTNKVTNPGIVALSNVRLTDDKCGPVKYVSGDTNGNSKLDIIETWTYTCSAKLTKTTVNTITASGDANGLTARDFAIVTVVVNATVPKLPNTGLPPSENNTPWNIIVPAGILAILTSLYFARRKQTA